MGVILEAPGVLVEVVPERGAKITRLRDSAAGREWLEQPRASLEGPVDTSVDFDDGDLCGWDEMMPTIDPCAYPGTTNALSDHGDLWRTPWKVDDVTTASVTTSVYGTSLPFALTRTIQVSASRVDLHYTLRASGSEALFLLYAAHPLFRYMPGTRIMLDEQPHRLVTLNDDDPTPVFWPVDGLDVVDAVASGDARKYFLDPSSRIATVGLRDPGGASLQMSWNLAELPYLGVWLDHGLLAPHPVFAIEPTNGFGDSLQRCVDRSSIPALAPGSSRSWSIAITLSDRRRAPRDLREGENS